MKEIVAVALEKFKEFPKSIFSFLPQAVNGHTFYQPICWKAAGENLIEATKAYCFFDRIGCGTKLQLLHTVILDQSF